MLRWLRLLTSWLNAILTLTYVKPVPSLQVRLISYTRPLPSCAQAPFLAALEELKSQIKDRVTSVEEKGDVDERFDSEKLRCQDFRGTVHAEAILVGLTAYCRSQSTTLKQFLSEKDDEWLRGYLGIVRSSVHLYPYKRLILFPCTVSG